jgi:hypothetical protein
MNAIANVRRALEVQASQPSLTHCEECGDEIPVKEFFSARLFTEAVLKELDEKIIKPTFKFPETQDGIDILENDELENLNNDEDSL